MLRYCLRIERLEEFAEFETLIMYDVELKKQGEERYYFKYDPELLSEFKDNLKDFSLEIMTMDEYNQKQSPFSFGITEHDSATITFKTPISLLC